MSSKVLLSENQQSMLDGLRRAYSWMTEGEFNILRAFVECAMCKELPKSGWSFMRVHEQFVREFALGYGIQI